MAKEKDITIVDVFTGTMWEAGIVKSLLDDRGIESFLRDAIRGLLSPWASSGGHLGATIVVVSSENLDAAREVVAEYKKNKKIL